MPNDDRDYELYKERMVGAWLVKFKGYAAIPDHGYCCKRCNGVFVDVDGAILDLKVHEPKLFDGQVSKKWF